VVTVLVRATIQEGWHLYSMTTPPGGPKPTVFALVRTDGVEPAGKALQPVPAREFDQNFQVDTEQYSREVEFAVPVRITDAAAEGALTLRGTVAFQVCDPKQCIPGKFAWEVPITIVAGPARPEASKVTPGALVPGSDIAQGDAAAPAPVAAATDEAAPRASLQGDAADVAQARSEGLVAYMWLAVYMGFLSLLTPCVFPMVPITVSYFTKHDGRSRGRGVADAAIYSLSIIVTFTLLGLLTSALFGATGIRDFAANPWVNILLAGIFVGLALNLFGFYEIIVPGSILTPLSNMSGKGGFVGTLLMGVTFTLTSFTCTVPFVGALLVSTAQGDWKWPVVGMLGYSVAFALPFFLLALFPQALSTLPKAGGWMVSIKVVMGFLELAAAIKFISNVDLVWGTQKLTRELFLSIWVAIAVVTAMYLLGKVRLPHEKQLDAIGVPRMLFSTAFLALAFFLFTGLQGASLGELEAFLPPISSQPAGGTSSKSGGPGNGELDWSKDYDQALVAARASGRPIFIDFTGYACTNCRWMEKNIFPRPEVRAALERFERVQLYTDGQGPEYDKNRELQEMRFKTVALPLYVIVDPATEREIGRVEGLTRDPSEFARFLEHSLASTPGAGGARVAMAR
jgi:thiol:disulfide interchange protein DsbD